MVSLKYILSRVDNYQIYGNVDMSISGIQIDSREVKSGDLFIAVNGTVQDGHKYIGKAIVNGATAIVCEVLPEQLVDSITYIVLEGSESKVGLMASAFYGDPSSKMKLIGVTGTNGKTTIATLLYQLFKSMGMRAGLLSTIENIIVERVIPSTHTTPDPISLNRLLSEMVEDEVEFCFMEVSSHSLDQDRVAGLQFDGAIFTNLTHDHLDYHNTFREYLTAKKRLFDRLDRDAFAVVNSDDKNGLVMLQNCDALRKRTYSIQRSADFHGRILERHLDGTLLEFDGVEMWSHFVGEFNALNLLAIYGTAIELNIDRDIVLTEISKLMAVSGRFETIRSSDGKVAIVDYAHTPDALKNVLSSIAGFRTGEEQLITVVGAGGDRDKTKRPEMAKEAASGSDRVILTSDNPRSEDPNTILADMLEGIDSLTRGKVLSIADRKEAIRTAVALANGGDIILIAGKGHEDYQEISGVKYHFDDREIVREIFEQ